jgi:hypothetical protein
VRSAFVVSLCLVACSACSVTASPRRTELSLGVVLEGEDRAPREKLTLAQARAARDVARDALERGWFFRAFDRHALEFVEGSRLPPPGGPPKKRARHYRVVRHVVVARSDRALDDLGIRAIVEMHERGVCGIRVGMPAAEVRARLGPPLDTAYPAAAGCLLETYRGGVRITACRGEVRDVAASEGCPAS